MLTNEKRDGLIIRLAACVLGIENTDDKGMAGDMKDIKEHLQALNGQVSTNTAFRKVGTWVCSIIAVAVIGILVEQIIGG